MSDLRSRTIRLAYTNPSVRPYLVELLASDRVAMEFETQDALDAYLKDHPKADKSKHTVKSEGGKDEGGEDEGGKGDHKPEKSESFGSKLKLHIKHILFDDFHDAWEESKAAFEDLTEAADRAAYQAAGGGGPIVDIVDSARKAPKAVKTFFANRSYRRKKMKALGGAIKKGAKGLGSRIAHAIKAEVHEAWDGVKAIKQALTPGSEALTRKQKKAIYSLGAYAAGAAVTAAGGGAILAAGAVGKSFMMHVGIKSVSHMFDSFAVHYEWGAEASHIFHAVSHAVSHVASDRRAADDDDKVDSAIVEAMIMAVSKILSDGMDDDAVKGMLSGKDNAAYDDPSDNASLDKLHGKSEKSKGGKSEKSKGGK
ncbi:MAG: hypothetical protein EBT79_12910, partial [Actinobacteria bacterium]|nr:hypothetical protein [Actinomycetota bacterium]